MVEWRALTVALLDRIAPMVRERLGVTPRHSRWRACSRAAPGRPGGGSPRERRADGGPPHRRRQRRHGILRLRPAAPAAPPAAAPRSQEGPDPRSAAAGPMGKPRETGSAGVSQPLQQPHQRKAALQFLGHLVGQRAERCHGRRPRQPPTRPVGLVHREARHDPLDQVLPAPLRTEEGAIPAAWTRWWNSTVACRVRSLRHRQAVPYAAQT